MSTAVIEPKTRRTRASKAKTADQFMKSIQGQPLATKVGLVKLLKDSIDSDAKALKEQLALIDQ